MPTRRFLAAIAGLSVVLSSLLLLGGGAAFAQQASSSSPSFHERVRESLRAHCRTVRVSRSSPNNSGWSALNSSSAIRSYAAS